MKRINFFRAGKHIASNGAEIEFSPDDLKRAVANYDPKIHEAPLVIGHPTGAAPAWGWVTSLEYSDADGIDAIPATVDAEFSAMVKDRKFPKVSASWYSPDCPTNPKPGNWYLRHLAFLGAEPPAVKGLKAVEFSEAEGIIDFMDGHYAGGFPALASQFADFLENFREWLLIAHDEETANKVAPKWMSRDLRDLVAVNSVVEESTDFSEGTKMVDKVDNSPELEQLKVEKAEIERQKAELKAEQDKRDKEYVEFAERKRAADRQAVKNKVDGLVKQGKVLALHSADLVEFVSALPAEGEINFSENEGERTKLPPRDWVLNFLDTLPKRIEFGESAPDDEAAQKDDIISNPKKIWDTAMKARAKVNEAAAKGESLSFSEAVQAVLKGA